tara:strand:+ start:390 stop:767 length:378 start_codon:yes stop_codon:yes gene_type:complete
MVWEDLSPSRFLSRSSFKNAISAAMAVECSTNGIIHLIAIARTAEFDIRLNDFDRIGKEVPVIANIRANGNNYFMEGFYYAGAIRAMLKAFVKFLKTEATIVNGKSIVENLKAKKFTIIMFLNVR